MPRIELGSPQEKELTSLVFTKLADFGWPDNDVLANFIVVMVANEKTRDEITSELSDSKATPLFPTFLAGNRQTRWTNITFFFTFLYVLLWKPTSCPRAQ